MSTLKHRVGQVAGAITWSYGLVATAALLTLSVVATVFHGPMVDDGWRQAKHHLGAVPQSLGLAETKAPPVIEVPLPLSRPAVVEPAPEPPWTDSPPALPDWVPSVRWFKPSCEPWPACAYDKPSPRVALPSASPLGAGSVPPPAAPPAK